MRTDLFDFELPAASIALRPASPRDSARLLVVQPDAVLRDLARLGIQVQPRLESISGRTASFADEGTTDVAAVVWATGYRTNYSWLDVPGAVVEGAVVNERGVTPVPGLSILGLPWLHTRGSALLGFVKDDAAWLACHVSRELANAVSGLRRTPRPLRQV